MKTMKTISLTHHLPITDPKSLIFRKFTESTATNHRTANLFTPLTIGDLRLPNRVIMAPMTRACAGAIRTPNGLIRQLLDDLAQEEQRQEAAAEDITDAQTTSGVVGHERDAARRLFVLRFVQPGLAGLMDGSG